MFTQSQLPSIPKKKSPPTWNESLDNYFIKKQEMKAIPSKNYANEHYELFSIFSKEISRSLEILYREEHNMPIEKILLDFRDFQTGGPRTVQHVMKKIDLKILEYEGRKVIISDEHANEIAHSYYQVSQLLGEYRKCDEEWSNFYKLHFREMNYRFVKGLLKDKENYSPIVTRFWLQSRN